MRQRPTIVAWENTINLGFFDTEKFPDTRHATGKEIATFLEEMGMKNDQFTSTQQKEKAIEGAIVMYQRAAVLGLWPCGDGLFSRDGPEVHLKGYDDDDDEFEMPELLCVPGDDEFEMPELLDVPGDDDACE